MIYIDGLLGFLSLKETGSHLLRHLIKSVTGEGKTINVRVMKFNISAISFYEKYGFTKTSNDSSFIYMKKKLTKY